MLHVIDLLSLHKNWWQTEQRKSTTLNSGRFSRIKKNTKMKGFVAFSYSSVLKSSPSVTVDQATDKCLLLFIPVLALLFGRKEKKILSETQLLIKAEQLNFLSIITYIYFRVYPQHTSWAKCPCLHSFHHQGKLCMLKQQDCRTILFSSPGAGAEMNQQPIAQGWNRSQLLKRKRGALWSPTGLLREGLKATFTPPLVTHTHHFQ